MTRRKDLVFAATLFLIPIALSAQQAIQPPPPTPSAHTRQPDGYRQESIEITLGPKEGMEYKYRMEQGSALLYAWTATANVNYDLHSEPAAGPKGYAETFDKEDGRAQAQGAYIAPFAGIHGWYWQNPSATEVTVTLTTAGFYTESLEFRKGTPVKTKSFK